MAHDPLAWHALAEPMLFSLLVFLVVSGAAILMLRTWHRPWWERAWVRRASWALLGAGIVGVGLRQLGLAGATPGASEKLPMATFVGAALLGPASVFALMLFWSLPLAGLVRGVARLVSWLRGRSTSRQVEVKSEAAPSGEPASTAPQRSGEPAETSSDEPAPPPVAPPVTLPRRALLEGSIAAIPALALGAGAVGVVSAYGRTRIVPRPMRYAALPPELAGLRVLQLTDLHLGAFVDLRGVAQIVEDAHAHAPDLVVITGDFCDHVPWLRSALESVKSLRPRLGIYGVFGNHEHFRNTEWAQRVYEAAEIDVLFDAHRALRVGGTELTLVGVDDPGRGGFDDRYYERAIDTALASAPSQGFKLGLCHRPSGFPTLANRGIDLTLSGHTHGAQVGMGERSLFEGLAPEARLWGRYALGERQLYTSSGAGHWFAFRLNCPSEAAIVTLERA